MCARVQSDVLRVLRVLRVPVFQFCPCLWRHVFGVLSVRCVLLGLYVLYALRALRVFKTLRATPLATKVRLRPETYRW